MSDFEKEFFYRIGMKLIITEEDRRTFLPGESCFFYSALCNHPTYIINCEHSPYGKQINLCERHLLAVNKIIERSSESKESPNE